MQEKTRPAKLENLLDKIRECIEKGNYIVTKHAFERQNTRFIDLPETLYVLKTGYEEKRKTTFDMQHNAWKYAIRGKTKRNSDIRVVVAFDEEGMLIITVIKLDE